MPPGHPGADCFSSPGSTVLCRLLSRCAQGEQSALAELYSLTSPSVYRQVRPHVRSDEGADAVLVSFYVAVWRRAAEFLDCGLRAPAWCRSLLARALSEVSEAEAGHRSAAERPLD